MVPVLPCAALAAPGWREEVRGESERENGLPSLSWAALAWRALSLFASKSDITSQPARSERVGRAGRESERLEASSSCTFSTSESDSKPVSRLSRLNSDYGSIQTSLSRNRRFVLSFFFFRCHDPSSCCLSPTLLLLLHSRSANNPYARRIIITRSSRIQTPPTDSKARFHSSTDATHFSRPPRLDRRNPPRPRPHAARRRSRPGGRRSHRSAPYRGKRSGPGRKERERDGKDSSCTSRSRRCPRGASDIPLGSWERTPPPPFKSLLRITMPSLWKRGGPDD